MAMCSMTSTNTEQFILAQSFLNQGVRHFFKDVRNMLHFASCQCTLLETGVHLMHVQNCDNRSKVDSVDFHIRFSTHIFVMNVSIVEVVGAYFTLILTDLLRIFCMYRGRYSSL